MRFTLDHLTEEAIHLAAAESLALSREHDAVAGQLGECRRLVLARILRTFPDQARLREDGQVAVQGKGPIGALSAAEATLLGVNHHG